jgi:sialidase-1
MDFKSLIRAMLVLPIIASGAAAENAGAPPTLRKVEDITVYRDVRFHCAFPSIVRRPDGELLVAFRRAPDRRRVGEARYWHADPNSLPMLVRSTDSGRTWSEPAIIYTHPFGGSQDPCMVQLRDTSILLTSYAWAWMTPESIEKLRQPINVNLGKFVFLGGYLVRSRDGGHTWEKPIVPPHIEPEICFDIFGQPIPAYNRGAMVEGKDGRLFWVVATNRSVGPSKTETHLLMSEDKGTTWKYSCPVAQDDKVTFNETSIYETPRGELVAFLRTANANDHLAIARSTDGGKSFQKWQDAGFQGNPFHALRLPDQRVLLVYGYRHPPFGIRARVLDAECTNASTAAELVLRDNGGNSDIGYPWSTMISDRQALIVYYFNQADGPRTIEGTIVDVN